MGTKNVELFLQQLNWNIKNKNLYIEALTHPSFAHENNYDKINHNQRLEFLGDAVLELIISDYLYRNYPNLPEGQLTKLRADVVCEASLVQIAEILLIGQYLRLGKGEIATGGQHRSSILADTIEAVIGALYLDTGFEYTYSRIIELFQPILSVLDEGLLRNDYKTKAQEMAQALLGITPQYRIVAEKGPDHCKLFEAQCYLEDRVIGKGTGRSKKEAEQAAAKEVFDILKTRKLSKTKFI